MPAKAFAAWWCSKLKDPGGNDGRIRDRRAARKLRRIQYVVRHAAASASCTMTFAIYVPPQAVSGRRMPVVTWLSGLTCTHANAMEKGEYRRTAAELGLIFVCPDTSPRGGGVPDDPGYDIGQERASTSTLSSRHGRSIFRCIATSRESCRSSLRLIFRWIWSGMGSSGTPWEATAHSSWPFESRKYFVRRQRSRRSSIRAASLGTQGLRKLSRLGGTGLAPLRRGLSDRRRRPGS